MKLKISTLFIFAVISISSLEAQVKRELNGHDYFVFCKGSHDSIEKVVIFLHGGLKNPVFNSPEKISFNFLIEENEDFLKLIKKENYLLIVPLTDSILNWVDDSSYCHSFLKKVVNKEAPSKKVVITGFSDGGTGAYRMFYNNPNDFEAVIIFNGYPQLNNHYLQVDYSKVTNKKVVFAGTKKDKKIPYEFLLTEYVKQKKYNTETFLLVKKGGHNFIDYDYQSLELLFGFFSRDNNSTTINTPPLHGLVYNDTLYELYKYRRRIIWKYAYGREYYTTNKVQRRKVGLKTKKVQVDTF